MGARFRLSRCRTSRPILLASDSHYCARLCLVSARLAIMVNVDLPAAVLEMDEILNAHELK